MDIAIAIDALVPGAQYFGTLTGGTLDEFDALDWLDERQKPTWPALQTASLEATKRKLKAQIDTAAERERLKYITAGTGQAMTYQQKAEEAAAFLSDENPDPAHYPLLSAEIGITAADITGVATIVAAAYRQWRFIGAQIEASRLGTKAAIESAEAEEAAQAAADAATWPNPQA